MIHYKNHSKHIVYKYKNQLNKLWNEVGMEVQKKYMNKIMIEQGSQL